MLCLPLSGRFTWLCLLWSPKLMEEQPPQMTVGQMPLVPGVPVTTYLTPFSIAGAKTQRRGIRAF